MKKKILIVSLAVALIAVAVGGTLAYFMDTDEVTNVFTVGSVEIVQDETNKDGTAFTQNKVLLPIVNTEAPNTDANYLDKVVTVTNTGKNDAYVRTFIAVPAVLQDILHLDTTEDNTSWDKESVTWTDAEVNGIKYSVVSFVYNDKLVAATGSATTGATTPAVLNGVYLDSAVDIQENASGVKQFCTKNTDDTYTFYDYDVTSTVNVLVLTQGVQADGFANGAASALESAFTNSTPTFTITTTTTQ